MNHKTIKMFLIMILLSGCSIGGDVDVRLSDIEKELIQLKEDIGGDATKIEAIVVPKYVDPNVYMETCYKSILEETKAIQAKYMNNYESSIFCCDTSNVYYYSNDALTRVILLTMPYEVDFEGAFPEAFTVTEYTDYDLIFSYNNNPIISYLAYSDRYLSLKNITETAISLGNGFSVVKVIHDQSVFSDAEKTKVNTFIDKLVLKVTEGR